MSSSVLKQIAALGGLSAAELKDRWRDLNGTEPPRYNRDFLLKRLAHRIQELAHGGIALSAREKMNRLLDDGGYDEIGAQKTSRREPQRKRGLAVLGHLVAGDAVVGHVPEDLQPLHRGIALASRSLAEPVLEQPILGRQPAVLISQSGQLSHLLPGGDGPLQE